MNIRRQEIQSNKSINETVSLRDTVSQFLSNFPDDAISWIDATCEVSTIAKTISEELNIPLPTNVVTTPGESNIKWKTFIMENIDKLNQYQKESFLQEYNDWFNAPLFESIVSDDDKTIKELKELTISKTQKFILDCDLYFKTINSGKLNNKLSLKWHVDNTLNVDEFIESVRNVVNVTEQDLTQNDIDRLVAHYEKYSIK